MMSFRTALLLGLLQSGLSALADEPRPAIVIRLDHPDRQARAVIDLFRGSRAAHPAAALAAWKRASREPDWLGKPWEALVAAFNPAMAGELRSLDGAELALWFEVEGGRPAWGVSLPADDGTFAALATSLVLSGGAAENPSGGMAIDRLGPPGSALMARGPHALVIAGSAEGLKDAKVRSDRTRIRDPGDGVRLAVEPGALDGSKSLSLQRLKAALDETRGSISGDVGLVGSTFASSLDLKVGKSDHPSIVDPRWLDWLPADRAMAAFAVATDPAPANWDSVFRLADRVEKADPARAVMAPIRLRLDLLSRALGIQLDGDLLFHLHGLAGWVGGDGRSVDRALLMLHLDDEAAAGRMFERIKPPPNPGPPPGPDAGQSRWLGKVDGRDLRLFRFGPSLVATWGDGVMECSLAARARPKHSVGQVFRDRWRDPKPALLAALWPSRCSLLMTGEESISDALAESMPILGSGTWKGPDLFRLEATWDGLDAVVRRFLDRIPLDPPTDH